MSQNTPDSPDPDGAHATPAAPPAGPVPASGLVPGAPPVPAGAGGVSGAAGAVTGGGDAKKMAIGAVTDAAVDQAAGDRLSANQKKLVQAAARGAVDGAMTTGEGVGAAVGAAKEVGKEGVDQAKAKAGLEDVDLPTGSKPKTSNTAGPSESAEPADGPGVRSEDAGEDTDDAQVTDPLGAGGTGPSGFPAAGAGGVGGVGGVGGKGGGGDAPSPSNVKMAAAAGSAVVAPQAMFMLSMMMFLQWLKSLLFALAAQAIATAQAFAAWALSALKGLAKPFTIVSTAVANGVAMVSGGTVAMSATAATASTAALSGLSVLAMLAGLFGLAGQSLAAGQDRPVTTSDCAPHVGAQTPGEVEPGTVDADMVANAQAVWAVFSTWGMPDENIAGILGNWEQESAVNPARVQGHPNARVPSAEIKQAALATVNGIGLGQWTGVRNTMLRDYAAAQRTDWWGLGLQLKFMASGDNPGSVEVFQKMVTTSMGTPAEAARHFHDKWEISADDAEAVNRRGRMADAWFARMSGWTIADGQVESVVGDFVNNGPAGDDSEKRTTSPCAAHGGRVVAPDGGMSMEQAQELMDLFNAEGDKFLDDRYGGSGPGTCNSGALSGRRAANCVSFSVYFLNKYTTFQQYPVGDGIQTAYSVSQMTGNEMSRVPSPYSVGSGPSDSGGAAGHTFIVLGVEGDKVILGEAGWCAYVGRVRVESAQALADEGWMFVAMEDELLPPDQVKTS